MQHRVECPNPNCRKDYQVAEEALGKRTRCPACGQSFVLAPIALPASATEHGVGAPIAETLNSAELRSRPTTAPLAPATPPPIAETLNSAELGPRPASSGTAAPSAAGPTGPTQPVPSARRRDAMPEKIGRFIVKKRLGAGAFGTVYRASDPQLGRDVALKVPKPEVVSNPRAVERFLREAQAAAQLRHPYIVPVYEAGRDGSAHYIASAFIEGQPLSDAIGEKGMEPRAAAEIVRKLGEGLNYAHEQGIIHRDIKPANIMLDGKGQPLIMDFGLARLEGMAEKITHDGAILGTPAFMAPEQAQGAGVHVTAASDQYSLGVVLYELLTGELPFTGPTPIVIHNVIHKEPPPPSKYRADLPRDLETICLKAMAKEAAGRYPSCQGLADDLRRWLNDEPIVARRMSLGERLRRWSRKNRIIAASAAAGLAGLLLAGLVVLGSLARIGLAVQRESAAAQAARLSAEEKAEAERREAEASQVAEESRRREQEARERELAAARQREIEANAYYARRIEEAVTHLANDRPEEARASLNGCPAELRNFEWGSLMRRCSAKVVTLKQAELPDSPFSADGNRLLLFERAGFVRVHDVRAGVERARFATDKILAAALSPDSSRIALAVARPTRPGQTGLMEIVIHDGTTGEKLRSLPQSQFGANSVIWFFRFSPDGKRLGLVGSPGSYVWDIADGSLAYRSSTGGSRTRPGVGEEANLLTPAGDLVRVSLISRASKVPSVARRGEAKALWVYNLSQNVEVCRLDGHDQDIQAIATCSDGQRFATLGTDKTIKVWDLATKKLAFSIQDGFLTRTQLLALSPKGTLVAATNADGSFLAWEVATGKELRGLIGEVRNTRGIALSENGQRLAFQNYPDGVFLRAFGDSDAANAIAAGTERVTHLAFSSDSHELTTLSVDSLGANKEYRGLRFWDPATGKRLRELAIPSCRGFRRLGLSDLIYTWSDFAPFGVWDPAKGEQKFTIAVNGTSIYNDVQVGGDGSQNDWHCFYTTQRKISTGTVPALVELASDGKPRPEQKFSEEGSVPVLALTHDGARLAYASSNGPVVVKDTSSGEELRRWNAPEPRPAKKDAGQVLRIVGLQFLPRTERVAIFSTSTSSVRTEPDFLTLQSLTGDDPALQIRLQGALCFAISPDEKRIAVAMPPGKDAGLPLGDHEARVHLFDATTGRLLYRLPERVHGCAAIAFSPDGRFLAASNGFGAVVVWDSREAVE